MESRENIPPVRLHGDEDLIDITPSKVERGEAVVTLLPDISSRKQTENPPKAKKKETEEPVLSESEETEYDEGLRIAERTRLAESLETRTQEDTDDALARSSLQ